MSKKVQIYILIIMMAIATIDFAYAYIYDGELELFYLGSVYLVSGIGLKALNELKEQPSENI